jgi:transcriptional regulator with XRE-family HTH domain
VKARTGDSNLAEYLKNKRVHAGLTQSDVARKMGYSSPQFVSNWERALARPPVTVLKELTKLYKVSADEVFRMLLGEVETELKTEFYGKAKRRN